MKVNFNSVSFGDRNICYHDQTHNIKETYDDRNHLIRITKYDKQCRDVDTQEFNEKREVIAHQHKKYTPDGSIETYKSKTQEYIRVIKTFAEDSFTHRTETFTSKTSPESNYVNEFIHDKFDKLVKVITNGKVIDLK